MQPIRAAIRLALLAACEECQAAQRKSGGRRAFLHRPFFYAPAGDEFVRDAQFVTAWPDGVQLCGCMMPRAMVRGLAIGGVVMGEKLLQESAVAISFPVFFLVRMEEVNDVNEMVRNTLRLGSQGPDGRRHWFVPVFTTDEAASQFANDVRKIDDKLRVIEIHSPRDWRTLLEALYARGDTYTAFDPQTTRVEHVAIGELLAGARQSAPEDPRERIAARSREPSGSRSTLRSRLKTPLAGPAGRDEKEVPSTDTERVQSNVTQKPPGRSGRQ
jgi:hypothetical protein